MLVIREIVALMFRIEADNEWGGMNRFLLIIGVTMTLMSHIDNKLRLSLIY